LSLQSEEETRYRLTLAEGYLERARKALASEDFSDTVSEAQLCVENAAKAVVSCFRIPGWSHDPSAELREVLESNQLEIKKSLGSDFLRKLGWLAEASHLVAPEHGRASYGDVQRRIPPWLLYSEEDARRTMGYAEASFETAAKFVMAWYPKQSEKQT